MIIMEIAPLIFIFEFGFLHYLLDFSPYLNEEEIKLHEIFESVNIWGVIANVRDCPYMEKIASCVGKLIFICKCLPLLSLPSLFPLLKSNCLLQNLGDMLGVRVPLSAKPISYLTHSSISFHINSYHPS